MAKANPVRWLRAVGLVEGVSFLLLVAVAMPLKYLAGLPGAVKVVGWAHGVLFVAFGAALAWTWVAARWPVGRAAMVVAASLVPLGPFLIDRRMALYVAEYEGRQGS
jgi:integral membrane protein